MNKKLYYTLFAAMLINIAFMAEARRGKPFYKKCTTGCATGYCTSGCCSSRKKTCSSCCSTCSVKKQPKYCKSCCGGSCSSIKK